jgi:glycine dehydrogenase subunit 1
MLQVVGLDSADGLFSSIPEKLLLKRDLDIGEAVPEMQLIAQFDQMAARNVSARQPCFLGAGAYKHYSPTIVDHLIQRSEFFTAYTPYQPEISQGTLQAIFEFQTLVCQLTGMDVANASMYDGSTGLAEAVLMAERVTRRSKVIASSGVHPEYLDVVRTYVQHAGIDLEVTDIDAATGTTPADSFKSLDEKTAAIVVQSPNFFGCIEDLKALADKAHSVGALLILSVTEAISFALLKSPGSCDVDIVAAEGQSFGIPMSYGGPYLGLFATKERLARQIPGRLVGEAYDKDGRRGFVLTLATREQHIRREKATSNICTNEGLIALAATIYLETMGRRGLQEVAGQCAKKATYTAREINKIDGYSSTYRAPVFNEFVIKTPIEANDLLEQLSSEYGINGGLALSRYFPERDHEILVCLTELNSRSEIDQFVAGLTKLGR